MGNKLEGMTSKVYAYWAFLVIPVFFEDAYFNIVQAKAHVSYMCLICVFVLILLTTIVTKGAWIKSLIGDSKQDVLIPLLLGFALAAGISTVLSDNPKAAFLGNEGWYIGGLVIIAGVIITLFLKENLSYTQNFWLPIIGVNLFVFALGIIQSAGIDVFGFHQYMVPEQVYKYISTIGNLNWFVGYLCLIVPIILVFFLNCDSGISFGINLAFLILAEMNMVLCGSDGLYLGFGDYCYSISLVSHNFF